MKHYHPIICPYCNFDDLVKNGHGKSGVQRWRCNKCRKSFQLDYKYNACKPGVREEIIQQTLNSSGVRDISRNLKIDKNTAVSVLKKTLKTNPYFLTETERQSLHNLVVEIKFSGEMDEFWNFVQQKSNQRWTWYAIERQSGCILAWHNGKRSDKDFLVLWNLLKHFIIKRVNTEIIFSTNLIHHRFFTIFAHRDLNT